MKFRNIIRITGYVFILAGAILVLGSLYINIKQQVMREAAIAEFKDKIYEVTELESEETTPEEEVAIPGGNEAVEGDILYILRIPSIDSENPVREGVSMGVLEDALGHEVDTAYAGSEGNCVIAGHRNYSFGQFFNRLDEVQVNDLIYLDTAKHTFSYIVKDIKVVEPTDLSVLEPTDEEILTLYTCTPIYIATHRLVITAERIG
ncbi:MAG: class D sortase [Lachnospiraceae bacterium]|nr:class D sortase [Lachnospiraceae bacterium]